MDDIREEDGGVPTNVVGGGAIHGVGVGPKGEPGVSKKKMKQILLQFLRRKVNGAGRRRFP